ncbi:MAG: HemK2/MTQ2 family protein methyltransferase [Candidatus Nanohaloarchaea archaeon]
MSVYPVREDTLLVKRNIGGQELEDLKFLEIGVGNAEISITASKKGADVIAVDKNFEAVEYANKRFDEKDLDAEIFYSDLFGEVKHEFDLVVFNPPYLNGPKGIGDEEKWRGGENGLETSRLFLEKVDSYLKDNGEAWIVLSSNTDKTELVEDYSLEEIDREKLWFETIFLYKFE